MKVFGVAGYAFVHLSNFVVDLFMYVASGVDFRLEGKQKTLQISQTIGPWLGENKAK